MLSIGISGWLSNWIRGRVSVSCTKTGWYRRYNSLSILHTRTLHATCFHLDRVLCTSEKLSKLRCLRVRSSDTVRLNGISRITFSALLTFDFRGLFLLLHLTRWLFVPLERNPHTLLLIYTDGTLTLQSAYGPICPPLCPAASHGWKRLFWSFLG